MADDVLRRVLPQTHVYAPMPPRAAPPLPPTNIEAEQALLGAVLVNNAAYGRVAEFLLPEHFANAVHGRIYAAIGKLVDRGQLASPVTLKNLFDQDGALAEIGGAQYLARLAASAVTIINAESYGRTLHDLYLRRELVAIGEEIIADAQSGDLDDTAAIQIDRASQKLFDAGNGVSEANRAKAIEVAIAGSLHQSEEAYKNGGRIQGLSTGLADLDHLIGGLAPGNLEILGARPSQGKSSLAGGIALCVADQQGRPVAVFSLEETAEQQAQRILASRSGVPTNRQRRGDIDMVQWDDLVRAAGDLHGLPLFIDDTPGLSVAEIRRRSRQLRQRQGIGLVVIDHLQLIRGLEGSESRRIEISKATGTLKQMAKELSVPVLLLSQLSRGVEARDNKRPMMSDLLESGAIEADADGVFLLYRPEYYLTRDEPSRRPEESDDKFNDRYERWKAACDAASGLADIIVAKRRNGPTGTVRVRWNASLTRFENLAEHERYTP